MGQEAEQKSYSYGKRPLWQWIVLYLVVGVVIYGIIYYFVFTKKGTSTYNQTGNQTPTTEQTTTAPSMALSGSQASPAAMQNAVTLTATGFSPTTLTVKVGTTVTWTNNSGEEATVNSDPHPIHTNYPPLNLGKFATGGTLSLTFTKAGTYGYHNHLNPGETGVIVVQ